MRASTATLIIAAVLSTSGCISMGKDVGRKFDPEARRAIKLQQTTKADVRRLFGEPFDIDIDPARRESWRYTYVKVTTSVPIFLPPLPGLLKSDSSPSYDLLLTFVDGIVVDCLYLEMHGLIGDNQPTRKVTEKCGQ